MSDEAGKDLVCASASILAHTLAENVANMAVNEQVRQPVLKMESGKCEIGCQASHKYRAVVTLVFDTVCAGFELLAVQYPAYIHYEIRG